MKITGRLNHRIIAGVAGLLSVSFGGGGATSAEMGSASISAHEQIVAGEAAYRRACALCHGADLDGPNAPALTGADILSAYHTVGGLYDYIAVSMPPQAPGKLPREDYAGIVAYILSANGACARDHALLSAPSDGTLNLTSLAGKCSQKVGQADEPVAAKKVPQAYTWGKKLPKVNDLP